MITFDLGFDIPIIYDIVVVKAARVLSSAIL